MNWRLMTTLLVFGFALTWVPAAEASPGRDKPKGDRPHKTGKIDKSKRTAAPVFNTNDRDVITGYYRNRSSNLPPGLAKRNGNLPPGLQRQLERNGTLPRGLQKRIDPFPQELNHQLQILSPGYTRGLIGGSAVIIDQRNRAIVDVIHNLLNNAGQ